MSKLVPLQALHFSVANSSSDKKGMIGVCSNKFGGCFCLEELWPHWCPLFGTLKWGKWTKRLLAWRNQANLHDGISGARIRAKCLLHCLLHVSRLGFHLCNSFPFAGSPSLFW